MLRRDFLILAAASKLARGQQPPAVEESTTASATEDATPRVAIVPSSFDGSEDHDGTNVEGLKNPKPVDADLSYEDVDAMTRKAIEIGGSRDGGLKAIIEPDDWVVIKTNIETCHGLGPETQDGGAHTPYIPGTVTDLRVIRSLLGYMADNGHGRRFSIVEGSGEWLPKERSKSPVDGWTTDWGGAFGGLTYVAIVEELTKKYPKLKFELIDLNFDPSLPVPAPAGAAAKLNKEGIYHVPKTIQECDKLISVAPMKTHREMGAALSIANFLGIAPGSTYGFPKEKLMKLGTPDELAVDLFGYHPAEFALVGGCWGIEGDGPAAPGGKSVHFNVVIAGGSALAVDAVASSVMGFAPKQLKYLDLAELNGFGIWDTGAIWVRGKEIEEAQRPFEKPSGWKA
ncbi:MAG: DUF362 domain-containing protein [Bryobacteraceae bacterium]|nr:DUF362 domain-containing protein [Bryobacteraceae bacterium]